MSTYVKSIKATGVFDRFTIPPIKFERGVNILHGKNGTGKTTLLHILANVLNGDFKRFSHMHFDTIEVELDEDRYIKLERLQKDDYSKIYVYINEEKKYEFSTKIIRPDISHLRISEDMLPSIRRRMIADAEEVSEKEEIPPEPMLKTAYFPAFRTMIEAWAAMRDEPFQRSEQERWERQATRRAREWFGEFVPVVNFPSLLEIDSELTRQIRVSKDRMLRQDRKLVTKAFLDIFKALSSEESIVEGTDAVLTSIKGIFDRLEQSPMKAESLILTGIYSDLRDLIDKSKFSEKEGATTVRILNVYRQMLTDIADVQETSLQEVIRYLLAVNKFLENKSMVISSENSRAMSAISIKFADSSQVSSLRTLSSGERQIATLMYAATHMHEQKVVLIDEPEISLHVDWQSGLLKKMSEYLGDRQIIACTHSPVIAEDYEDSRRKLKLEAKVSAPDSETVDIDLSDQEETTY
ncbi:MAG: AAA family ATPase [Candidatus Taylorbacteria bacterium]